MAQLRGSIYAHHLADPGTNTIATYIEPKKYTFMTLLKCPLKFPHRYASLYLMRKIRK